MEAATYTLYSTLTSLDALENATLDVARKAGFHGDALEKIGLALREIAANAIWYADAFPLILNLAGVHGLICYDPQNGHSSCTGSLSPKDRGIARILDSYRRSFLQSLTFT